MFNYCVVDRRASSCSKFYLYIGKKVCRCDSHKSPRVATTASASFDGDFDRSCDFRTRSQIFDMLKIDDFYFLFKFEGDLQQS